MEACYRLLQGFGSRVNKKELCFLKNNIHVTNKKLYFPKSLEIVL